MTLRQKIVNDLVKAGHVEASTVVDLVVHSLADHITNDNWEFLWEAGAHARNARGEQWFDRDFGSVYMREVLKHFIDR